MYSTRCVEPLHGYTGPERLISDGVAQPARRGHVRVVRRKQPPDGSMRDDGSRQAAETNIIWRRRAGLVCFPVAWASSPTGPCLDEFKS
jgi:hypothetical protein